MNEKLNEIHNSYINGQPRQMVEQIKAYGVKKFHVDFLGALFNDDAQDPNGIYAAIVSKFHRMTA